MKSPEEIRVRGDFLWRLLVKSSIPYEGLNNIIQHEHYSTRIILFTLSSQRFLPRRIYSI